MKIIVIGAGKVGYTVAEQLIAEGHDVVIVDTSRDVLRDALDSLDAIGVHGNGAVSSVLLEAGADNCGLLIALTGSDELNLLSCLIASRLGAGGTIARVRNPEYHRDLGIVSESLSLTMALNPEYEAALEIFRILKYPSAISVDIFSRGKVDLVSFEVGEECLLCGKSVREAFSSLSFNVLACAVNRDTEVFIPRGDFEIKSGDIVAAMIPPDEINGFFKQINIPVKKVKSVMIVGGGVIAEYLASELCRAKCAVTVIEKDRERAENLSFLFPDANIVCADGTDRDMLLEEGLSSCDALCSLTGFDEENIFLSLFAQGVREDIKTVTKVNKIAFKELTGILDMGSVVYPKYITSDKILRHVRAKCNNAGGGLENLYRILGNKAEALEFSVSENSPLADKPIFKLPLKPDVLIGAVTRKDEVFIPHGTDRLLPGDAVTVVTLIQGLSDLEDILRDDL